MELKIKLHKWYFSKHFEKVSEPGLLGKTEHGRGGFGSTGSDWNVLSKRAIPPMLGLGEVCVLSGDSRESESND